MDLAWSKSLADEMKKSYFVEIKNKIQNRISEGVNVYPAQRDVLKALSLTPLSNVKVVILGQDPYHGEGQANGLAFSVKSGVKIPPSLVNIFKELESDIEGFEIPKHGDLTTWAEQGVLLLNTVLSVDQGKAHSHANFGWETFTDSIINIINNQCGGVVFLLWGSHAQKKGRFIDAEKHTVLTSVHPSPLSAYRGFLGCKHFSKTNEILIKQGQDPINWELPEEQLSLGL